MARKTQENAILKDWRESARLHMSTDLKTWLSERKIEEVECIVPDMSGVARGKVLPTQKFLKGLEAKSLAIPEAIFCLTVTGGYPEETDAFLDPAEKDVVMVPDPQTVRVVPWYEEPTAQIICDCFHFSGEEVSTSPRGVLKRVLKAFEERGMKPVIAPELEFYLVAKNTDPDNPLEPPIGRSGRPERASNAFGIDAINEFDPLIEDLYDYCEAMNIDADTMSHESGPAQLEMNFNHGDPLELADQAFLFKRTLRETALKHGVYGTFMAKPMGNLPGSSMHIHQSVLDIKTGKNLFADDDGENSKLFLNYIGGLQRYLPAAMPLLAPNMNSYRRLQPWSDAPINMHWSLDNRTVGLRQPNGPPAARRVENRLPGADANPYLAIAASLACGLLGILEEVDATAPIEGSGYDRAHSLPRHIHEALAKFHRCKPLKELLGEEFAAAVIAVKEAEWDAYQTVISAWEREHLLLNV
jgi:glutamine synthetase|tara:strand:+ start:6341 stop:7753 length:1413 start_codon:yes stop_codon:yes gene_type:complete